MYVVESNIYFRWLIYWHTLEEWAMLIYSWAQASGSLNTVCTFFELVNGDDTTDQGLGCSKN